MSAAIALAAVAGVLHFLGFVGFGIWPLALLCLPLFWEAIERVSDRPRGVLLVGLVFGWVSYAGGYFWLWHIVDVFLSGNLLIGALIWGIDSMWFALRYVLYAAVYGELRRRGRSVSVAGVAPLVLVEWLYPLLFPVHFGHALSETRFIQMSDVGGPLLVSAFAATLSAAVFATWRWLRGLQLRPTTAWIGAGTAVLVAWIYGTVCVIQVEATIAAARSLRVGVVQGNLGVQEKGRQSERDHRRYLDQTRELLAEGDVDLVIWPETVFTRGLRGPLPVSGELIRDDIRVPLLFGAAFVGVDNNERRTYNAALLVGADGVIRDVYRKNLLVPFTEFVPFADYVPSLTTRFADASHFAAADDVPALSVGAARIATPICYEAVRSAFVRRMVNESNANLIVTLANDAWFDDSQGPRLHLAMAKLRAIELRRFMVRATDSGISAIVGPTGRIVTQSGVLVRANLRAEIGLLDQVSVYALLGDWPGWLAAGSMCVTCITRRSRGPRLA